MKTEVSKKGKTITLDRNRSIVKSLIVFVIFLGLSLAWAHIFHWKVGALVPTMFFSLAILLMLPISLIGNYTKAIIDIEKKQMVLTSKLVGRDLKKPRVVAYRELLFDSYVKTGGTKYQVFVNERDSEPVWDDLYPKQVDEISDLLKQVQFDVEKVEAQLLPFLGDLDVVVKIERFPSGARMIDIRFDGRFFCLQLTSDYIGLSEITEEDPGFSTLPNQCFTDFEALKTEILMLYNKKNLKMKI